MSDRPRTGPPPGRQPLSRLSPRCRTGDGPAALGGRRGQRLHVPSLWWPVLPLCFGSFLSSLDGGGRRGTVGARHRRPWGCTAGFAALSNPLSSLLSQTHCWFLFLTFIFHLFPSQEALLLAGQLLASVHPSTDPKVVTTNYHLLITLKVLVAVSSGRVWLHLNCIQSYWFYQTVNTTSMSCLQGFPRALQERAPSVIYTALVFRGSIFREGKGWWTLSPFGPHNLPFP